METKVCGFCKTEKKIDNFYNKYRQCKPCNIFRSTRRYYGSKDKISNEHEIYYEKNRDVLLAKLKINQQNRKSHTQQMKDFDNEKEKSTQAMGTLTSKTEYIYNNL